MNEEKRKEFYDCLERENEKCIQEIHGHMNRLEKENKNLKRSLKSWMKKYVDLIVDLSDLEQLAITEDD